MEPKPSLSPGDAPTTLHVFPSFGFGGQQARFASIVNGLGARYNWCVVSLDGDFSAKALLSDAEAVQFHALSLSRAHFALLRNRATLRALFSKIQPDILCTYNWGAIEAANAWPRKNAQSRIHFEDGFGPGETITEQIPRRIWARRFILSAGKTIVPSRTLETTARDRWRLPANTVLRIPNGVRFDRFQQARTARHAGIVVGTVGALRPEKNFLRLIRAFSKVESGDNTRLVIVGDGPERDRLRDTASAEGACERIIFTGATNSPENMYKDFDIFALSSDTEQAPLTVIEAMASGLPIVAPDVGDIKEMVCLENRPFITTLSDDNAYERALSTLTASPDLRAALGAANRKKAREDFDAKKMIARHHALYQSALGRHDDQH